MIHGKYKIQTDYFNVPDRIYHKPIKNTTMTTQKTPKKGGLLMKILQWAAATAIAIITLKKKQ
jgi:hypothetical protein